MPVYDFMCYTCKKQTDRLCKYETKDDHTCRDCGATENLEAHHIFSKSKHPDRILEIDNGTTLCEPCHKYEHKINGEI